VDVVSLDWKWLFIYPGQSIGRVNELTIIMLLRGFVDAFMMRSQQALAIGNAQGYLPLSTTTRFSQHTAPS
jgi:cytochrome o ubiquinol oxidase subunit I